MLSWEPVSSPLNFHLEHYEGPLDLLLDLIRRQQIDIKDIPIATITQQYLSYMEKARELDIDLGAEFVYMAATLIHIKSKMLLPVDPALQELAPEGDPRQELVDRLRDHGYPSTPYDTRRDIAARIGGDATDRLSRLADAAVFGPGDPGEAGLAAREDLAPPAGDRRGLAAGRRVRAPEPTGVRRAVRVDRQGAPAAGWAAGAV